MVKGRIPRHITVLFAHTQLRLSGLLRVLVSRPSFALSFSLQSGLVFLQRGEAWRLSAHQPGPFILSGHLSLLPLSRRVECRESLGLSDTAGLLMFVSTCLSAEFVV